VAGVGRLAPTTTAAKKVTPERSAARALDQFIGGLRQRGPVYVVKGTVQKTLRQPGTDRFRADGIQANPGSNAIPLRKG